MLLVLVAVFGTVGVVTVRAVRSELMARLDRSMEDGARGAVAATQILTPEQTGAFAEYPSQTAWVLVDERGVHYGPPARDADGEIPAADLGGYSLDDLLARAGQPFTVDSVNGSENLRVVSVDIGDRSALVMARSTQSIDETVGNLRRIIVAISGAALVVTVIAVVVVARTAMRPVDEMIDLAHAIGDGELSRRAQSADANTEVGRLANALNAMLERLEQAFHDKELSEQQMREFLSDASHELRNPLTSIRTHAEMFRNPGFAPEATAEYAARIEAEAVRMGRLVDDLLLLARLDKGRELESCEVDLVALVTDSVNRASLVDPDRAVSLLAPAEPVVVVGDEQRLRQAIDNLLTNVRVHAGHDASASVRIERSDDDAVISVVDDGAGVDATELARLTDRFFRAECAKQQGRPGTGLGLSIVAAVVAGHDGTVELESNGHGFAATMRLPLTPVEPQPVGV
jgi:two-component system OmpR family sensor kinase